MEERALQFTDDVALKNTRTTLLDRGDPEQKREEIRRYFHDSFSLDEALYETLKNNETFYKRADALRHPLRQPSGRYPLLLGRKCWSAIRSTWNSWRRAAIGRTAG